MSTLSAELKTAIDKALVQEVIDKQTQDMMTIIGRNIDTFALVHPTNSVVFSTYLALVDVLMYTLSATSITAENPEQADSVKRVLALFTHHAVLEELRK